ncbi:hypothetical protein C3V43_10845 [Bacteroides heparinolyticus]|nr:hypothetical protein C3V43_10845 [Bacteroides heparinolyticus]
MTEQEIRSFGRHNLHAIQRMVHAIFSIWKHKRRKHSGKCKETAELTGELAHCFTQSHTHAVAKMNKF